MKSTEFVIFHQTASISVRKVEKKYLFSKNKIRVVQEDLSLFLS